MNEFIAGSEAAGITSPNVHSERDVEIFLEEDIKVMSLISSTLAKDIYLCLELYFAICLQPFNTLRPVQKIKLKEKSAFKGTHWNEIHSASSACASNE